MSLYGQLSNWSRHKHCWYLRPWHSVPWSPHVVCPWNNISLCVVGHMYLGADFKLFRIFVENFEETNSVLFHKCENIIIIIIIIAIIIIIIIIIDTRRVQTGKSTSCPSQEKRVISSALLATPPAIRGTVGEIKERLKIYSSSLKSRFILDNIKADKIHFRSLKDSHPLKVRCAPTMNWYMLRGRTSKWLSLFKWKRMVSGWEG